MVRFCCIYVAEDEGFRVFSGNVKETPHNYVILSRERYCSEFLAYVGSAKRVAKNLLFATADDAIDNRLFVEEQRLKAALETVGRHQSQIDKLRELKDGN